MTNPEISKEEAHRILYEDCEYTPVTREEIYEQDRWYTYYKQVFKKSDGTFWELDWGRGSTEQQEYEGDYYFIQVKPVEKTITVYEPVGPEL